MPNSLYLPIAAAVHVALISRDGKAEVCHHSRQPNRMFPSIRWSAHRGACSHDVQIGALLGAPSRETPQLQNLAMELRKVGLRVLQINTCF